MLYEVCVTFQEEIDFNGMKDVLDNGEFRGASGQFDAVKVLCAEMCGYDRVMLEDNSSYVTFQLRPGSKHMYVLGQQGTLPQIRNLVRTVVRIWREARTTCLVQAGQESLGHVISYPILGARPSGTCALSLYTLEKSGNFTCAFSLKKEILTSYSMARTYKIVPPKGE
jgi:hypothetical protein